MKIAFVLRTYGTVFRGGETYVGCLSNHLRKLDHQIFICKNTLALPTPAPDIVVNVNGRLDNFYSRLWTKFHRCKLVVSGQSGPGWDDRLNLWTFPDVFVALTDCQFRWAKRANPAVRVEKIPNGVDLGAFSPQVKPTNLDLPRPVILNVAALEPIKRQDLLIRAVAKISKGSLLLVGKGEEEGKLGQLGQKLLGERFKIISLPYSQIPAVYSAADIFAFPTSPWESFGMAMLEAMASGLPVVATDDPIRREIVGDAGLFVNPTNTIAYAQALKKALHMDWKDKPKKQAEKFSWDKIAVQYDQLFKNI